MKAIRIGRIGDMIVLTVMCNHCGNIFNTYGPAIIVMCHKCGLMVPGFEIEDALEYYEEEGEE